MRYFSDQWRLRSLKYLTPWMVDSFEKSSMNSIGIVTVEVKIVVNDILSWALITFLRKAQFSFQVCTRRNPHLRFADCLSNSNSESKLLVSSKSICRTFAILREQQLLIAHFSNIRHHHHHVFCVLSFCFTFPHLPATVQYQQLFAYTPVSCVKKLNKQVTNWNFIYSSVEVIYDSWSETVSADYQWQKLVRGEWSWMKAST